jgi:hypothetical protein
VGVKVGVKCRCGRDGEWLIGEDVCDLNRSYGRRIQSKIVKRCPGGIDSMPTAEQAMMRMLLVCLSCACVCLAACLPGCLCGLGYVVCWGVHPPFHQQHPSNTRSHAHTHTNTLAVAGLWGRQCGVAKCARNDGARDAAGEPLPAQYSKN